MSRNFIAKKLETKDEVYILLNDDKFIAYSFRSPVNDKWIALDIRGKTIGVPEVYRNDLFEWVEANYT